MYNFKKPADKIILLIAGSIIIIFCAAFILLLRQSRPDSEKIEPVRLGTTMLETSIPVYIAERQDFFRNNGLNVILRYYDTGLKSIDGIYKNEIDIASAVAEFVFVGRILNNEKIQAIASFDKVDYEVLIARKDRGIYYISHLKGKRIGFIRGTIQEFYLARFLEINNMDMAGVKPVHIPSLAQTMEAIIEGDIDAAVTIPPYMGHILKKLGPNAVMWKVQNSQPVHQLLVAKREWIKEHQVLTERLLKAFKQAEDFIIQYPKKAGAVVKHKLKIDDKIMAYIWSRNHFSLTLDQSLIAAMEDEARWIINNKLTGQKEMPDFRDYIYTEGLKSVKPYAVNIIGY